MEWGRSKEIVFEAGNAQLNMRSTRTSKIIVNKSIRKEITEKQLSGELEDLKSLQIQGTCIDIKNADY